MPLAGIAIHSVIALSGSPFLYGAYGLAIPTWLLSLGLLYIDLFLKSYGTHR